MKKEDQYPHEIARLIVARMSETITPEQELQLDAWRAQSDANERLYRRIATLEGLAHYSRQAAQYDYRPKLDVLCRRIGRDRRIHLLRRSGYVAAVLLPVLVAVVWFARPAVDGLAVQNGVERIEPGKARAQLILEDGRTVELGSNAQSLTRISNDIYAENDTLHYVAGSTAAPQAKPEMHTLSIPRGGEYFIRLADGTGVWLNADTRLRYPAAFAGPQRTVCLEGEAYFDVAHDASRPFTVISGDQRVTVLGTSFAVRAYADERTMLTTLESGSVQVAHPAGSVKLLPGQQAVVSEGVVVARETNTALYTAWHAGKFVFIDQPLEEILSTLSRWYDIDMQYSHPQIGKIRFTGELKRYSCIDELLAKFETVEKVRFAVKDRVVVVSKY